jgi:multiple sugar transport system ATP-binding protein
MASVTLEGMEKIYDDRGKPRVAVHSLDLEIQDGEFLVLVGPSGCGKSTTLRMIAGLESISRGTLRIGGQVANDVAARDRDIAMVFQSYALYPHMTVRENMAFALRLRRMSRNEIQARVEEAAALLGLSGMLDRRPRQLSGGERQRVALGRAIVRQPSVFLFDEPLSNLDASLRVQMRREIARLHARLGTTMIYVTHDQVEAMTLGDRIAVLSAGRLQQVDTPMTLYRHPANLFVAGFIGSPPMNRLRGVFAGTPSRFELAGSGLAMAISPPPRPVSEPVLGIRPETVTVKREGSGLPARVTLVEPLGAEALIYLEVGGQDVVARVEQGTLPEVDATVGLAFRPDDVIWFDGGTGEALSAQR